MSESLADAGPGLFEAIFPLGQQLQMAGVSPGGGGVGGGDYNALIASQTAARAAAMG